MEKIRIEARENSEYNKDTKYWFAVQEDETSAWDWGSYDYSEAVEMAADIARESGEALIAYIDERYSYCDHVDTVTVETDE